MKTWQAFNDAVNDLLLVDGSRKGRGIERFRDRQIVNGVRDLQRYIPLLREHTGSVSFTGSDLEDHSEGKAEIGDFNYNNARITDIVIRRLPDEDKGEETSTYFRPKVYAELAKFSILDGGNSPRTGTYPGKIVFENGKFYSAPLLRDDETLTIYFTQEKIFKPIFECNGSERQEQTKLGDDEALAVYHYVKYHFQRDVNDDSSSAQNNFQIYQQLRRSIFANLREQVGFNNTASTETLGEEGFLLGDG
jgi:hypothetical protein